jgi:N-acetylmuramoyl-L-alanine amidase
MAEVILPPIIQHPSPNHVGPRSVTSKIVVHVTVGSWAGAVSWLSNPKSQVSAHGVLNETGTVFTQLVPWLATAWHAADANSFSEGIELAGYPGRESHEQLRIAARIVAFRLHKHGLPARYAPEWSTAGFCRHGDLGVRGGDHPSCPMPVSMFVNEFVPMVHHEAERGGFRPSWGVD